MIITIVNSLAEIFDEKKDTIKLFLETNYPKMSETISSEKITKRKTVVVRRLTQYGMKGICSFILFDFT